LKKGFLYKKRFFENRVVSLQTVFFLKIEFFFFENRVSLKIGFEIGVSQEMKQLQNCVNKLNDGNGAIFGGRGIESFLGKITRGSLVFKF